MDLSQAQRERFEADGYAVLRGFWAGGEMDELQAELQALGELIVGPRFDVAHFERYELPPDVQSLLYDRLKYLPALSRLSGSVRLQRLCRALGLGHPSLMGCCNMRLDKPGGERHLFDWHQDTLYLLGSTNAITAWLPLQKVNLLEGTIEVIAGSHRDGLAPFVRISDKPIAPHVPMLQRDLKLAGPVRGTPVAIEAERGDLVVFKQMLLHRSTPNRGRQVRWTAQLRVTDLAESAHRAQGYPCGDRRNIFYVDYPGHIAAVRRAQESAAAAGTPAVRAEKGEAT